MAEYSKYTKVLFILFSLLAITCVKNRSGHYPQATIIVGDVAVSRDGNKINLSKGMYLAFGDTIHVSDNGKLKLELKSDGRWFVGKNSKLVIGESVAISEDKRRLQAHLLKGMLHIVKRNDVKEEYSVITKDWIIRATSSDITIGAGNSKKTCCVSLLRGFAAFMVPGGTETVLPECTKLHATSSGPGELAPLSDNDISELKSWVGNSVVEEALALSGCKVDTTSQKEGLTAEENKPPEWESVLEGSFSIGEKYKDTLHAVDPENESVIYQIIKTHEGLKLEPKTGIVTFTPMAAGEFNLLFSAADAQGKSCTTSVTINVSDVFSVRLRVPRMVVPGDKFSVSAKIRGNKSHQKIVYRFDLDGDGKYEFPGKGKFSTRRRFNKCTLEKEGVFRIRVQAKNKDGLIVKTYRKIVVNSPPEVVVNVKPDHVMLGNPVIFDASGSSDSRNGNVPLLVQYDIDNDGEYDLPSKSTTTSAASPISYIFQDAGEYIIRAKVTDKDRMSSYSQVMVTVMEGFSGGEIKGPDTVQVNTETTFSVTGIRNIEAVTKYTWSFNEDYENSHNANKNRVTLTFKDAGVMPLSCILIGKQGQRDTLSRNILVVNSASEIDAGGPYKTGINKSVLLSGRAADNDNKITKVSWDVNGDGNTEWVSASDTSFNFSYIYKKSGKYKAVFSVTTDDNVTVSDTADVTVTNINPVADAGKKRLSRKNRKLTLNGTGSDKDGEIVLYEWDFEGDGKYDWTSSESGQVKHRFVSYTTAVLRVTDADGATGTDSVTIVICPNGMEAVEKGMYCIDKYEYPNKRKSIPRTNISYENAKKICAEKGKRLCTPQEWEQACKDTKKKNNYPYGKKYKEEKCNTLGNPRLKNSIAPSGDFIECNNANGIYDMSGNTAEWVEASGKDHYVYGGSYQNGKKGSTCGSRVKLKNKKEYFFAGFRCCK